MSALETGAASLVPIASYPKSGNTWIRALLTAWFRGQLRDLGDLVAPPILCLRRHFDDTTGVASSDLTLDEVDRLRPSFHRALASEMGNPCFVKVHDRWYRNKAGEPVFDGLACRGAIHLVRHPAAVAVSYAHHLKLPLAEAVARMADEDTLHDWWSGAIDTRMPQRLGSWSTHCTSWQDQREFPVLTLRYEDLLHDPALAFAAILEFVGLVSDPKGIAGAIAACDFARLQRLEADGGFRERSGDHAFFREGRGDGWRGEVGEGLLDRILADHGAAMARFGYDRAGAA